MRPSITKSVLATSILAASLGLVPSAFAQDTQMTAPPRTMEESVEATATVTAVDKAKRTVTFETQDGNMQTVTVGPEMQRFDEIGVGDTIRARYSIGITGELRPATAEEKKDPYVVLEGAGTSPDGTAPAAGAAKMVRIVATIYSLHFDAKSVTLKGPQGNFMTVAVKDPSLLNKVAVGDDVVVTAAESVALSLEKVDAKKK